MSNHEWLKRERASLGAVMQRRLDPMFGPVIVRGQGSRVWDAEGRQYFDLTCGYSASNFGHAFQPLVSVAREQLSNLAHLTGQSHPGRAQLAEMLIEHCGRPGDRVIFNTSGARAIETAIKIAWSNRPGKIVSIGPAYHGRSLATAVLSDTARVPVFDSERCVRWNGEFAYCQVCPIGRVYPECQLECQRGLVKWLEENHRSISAVVVEPAFGARGYIAPPSEYWLRLRELTARYGILMIADEIQMGLGRAGHWLLSRHQGWNADLIVLGKSLGGGIVPISAVIGQRELLDALPAGSESETFAASPLATAIGCEVLSQLAHGPWLSRASHLGSTLAEAIKVPNLAVQADHLGAATCIEFASISADLSSAASRARDCSLKMLAAGLLVHYTGPYATRIVLLPPLTINDDELTICAAALQCMHSSP